MKRRDRFEHVLLVLVSCLSFSLVKREQPVFAQSAVPSGAASGSSTPAAQAAKTPYVPQLIQLPDRPPAKPEEGSVYTVNPITTHPAPMDTLPSGEKRPNFPEMVDDGNGGLMVARVKESFSKLVIDQDSKLVAQEPIFGSREEYPTFIRELWQLRWRPNDPIDFYIILPRNVKKPPVVLYLYGFPNDTDRFKDTAYCTRVTQFGAAAIGFVSALTGQRYEYRPFKNWFVSELPESLASTVHDVQMILNQIQTRQDLDLTRVGMFGQGSGGAIAIMAAAVDPRIKTLDLLDPWGDWPDWFAKADAFPEAERPTYLQADFQKNLEPLEPVKYLPALKDRQVRIQFVKDNGEPEDAVKKLEAAAPPNATVKRFATGHDLYQAYQGGQLFQWVANELHAMPGSPTQAANSSGKPLH